MEIIFRVLGVSGVGQRDFEECKSLMEILFRVLGFSWIGENRRLTEIMFRVVFLHYSH
jgi:hypothetical protein